MRKEMALIGYGRFGRLAAQYLRKEFRISVFEPRKSVRIGSGVSRVSFREAARMPVVILSVPINRLPSVLRRLAPELRPGTLVCDVCSVKEEPVRWMKDILPGHVSILGTHPLFGPDSARMSLKDRSIILCPVRIENARLKRITLRLKSYGLKVSSMKPATHDKLMASTLFLTHFIGRGLLSVPLPLPDISSLNYQRLAEIVQTARRDTSQLFTDMYRYNRFAAHVPVRVIKSLGRTALRLRD